MSAFNGLFGMQGSILGALGKAIDPSHHPFKRSLDRPGGPGHRPDEQTHQWDCEWRPPGKDKKGRPAYRQVCTNIKTGKKKTVYINKAYKKKYNKKYRAGKFPKAARFKKDKVHPYAGYSPSRSRTWAAASAKKKH